LLTHIKQRACTSGHQPLAEQNLIEDDLYPGLPLARNHFDHIFLLPDICEWQNPQYYQQAADSLSVPSE
jgi:hypothetical protein